MKKVCVIDYGIGNVRSIMNALKRVGADPVLSNQHNVIIDSDALVLPGVGAFGKGMENLNSRNLAPSIYDFVNSGKPFLGICLGMQMMLEESDEFGINKGLGLIPGKVQKLDVVNEKLPHISWNELKEPYQGQWAKSPLRDVSASVYFVHTYAANPSNPKHILSYTTYDNNSFCSAVIHENVFGVQFHPEKSGETGLKILMNFVKF
jgi:glutamine amidotransferase